MTGFSDYRMSTYVFKSIIIKSFFILFTVFFILSSFSARPAGADFTIEDEKKLGKEFYDKLDKHDYLIRNKKVNNYITRLGNTILKNIYQAPFEYRFSVVKSSAVNAFATPGGYIYVNQGLINLVENESELAGVLAHEIAHANCRHIASIIEKSTKVSVAALAATLAAALLGGGGDLGAALTVFPLAAATTLNLQYSREHEEEADRIGMGYLVSAGYSPGGMPAFLKLMRRYEFYSKNVPSYFLTHPGTSDRIRYLDALMQTTYRQKGSDNQTGRLKRIQTILLFNSTNLNSTLKHFQEGIAKNPDSIDDLYGMAFTFDKLGQSNQALEAFQRAIRLAPNDEDILRDMGIAYFKLGRTNEAIPLLQRALSINADDEDIIQYLGRSYAASGDYRSALDLYKRIEDKRIDAPDLYYNIALAYGNTNQQGFYHYYLGMYFKKAKKTENALYHFRAALPFFAGNIQQTAKIDTEIKALKDPPKVKPGEKQTRR